MKIRYEDAEGKVIELDVSTEVGTFYLAAVEAEKKNDRRNMRPDRTRRYLPSTMKARPLTQE